VSDRCALDGVRVVDFTHILAGPYCTQLMADAGATVIKVEPPGGEWARVRGPRRVAGDGTTVSAYHAAVNRGKRSIALDLKHPLGLEVADQLIAGADVVIENFAPGALRRLGIDFTELRARHPRLITASISLFGGLDPGDPLRERGGLAIVAEAESSILGMTRDESGTPVALGFPLGDMATGLACYAAIVTTLLGRASTGVGGHLELSMIASLLAINARSVTSAQIDNFNPLALRSAGYGIFPTRDGFVAFGINSDSLFHRLAGAIGDPRLTDDARFAEHTSRDEHADEVDAVIAEWTGSVTSAEAVERVAATGVPCGKVASAADVLEDADLRRLGFLERVDDGIGGTFDVPTNPLGFHNGVASLPRLGGDTREVLREIGFEDDRCDELAAAGAFGVMLGRLLQAT
jgi:crotonobetainyl-CoA:carnitine CoA-transferase CaiB-like acyl-CoA transferase